MLKAEEANKNFVHWYRNYFTKSVRGYQKVKGKVLLLLSQYERFIIPEDIKDNSFKILYIPLPIVATFQPLDQAFREKIRHKYDTQFLHFCQSGDIGNFIEGTCKPWADLTSEQIQTLWKKLFESDFRTKEDNITEKDIAEEISKPQSSRETERDKQEHQENTVSAENSGRIENTESTEEKVEEEYLTHMRELYEKSSNYIDLDKVPDLKSILGQSSSSNDSTEDRSSFGKAKGEGTSRRVGNLIEGTCKPWTNITSAHIKTLMRKLFESDFHLIPADITEENTAEEISKSQNSRETDRDKQEHQENTVSAANSGHIENTESTEEKVEEEYLTHMRELDEKPSNYIDLNKAPDLNTFLEQSSSSNDSTEDRSSFGKAKGEGTSGRVGKN
ncbi:hypothetical protein EAG_05670 [Camponotus floridanus]|uniref:DDE-1 domain-containing protein n=1 Tax=Camponotus floridanus TaxID=104421 RepID=E1ZXV9_CAMFO|nr:hypothetical protein EAG_05670 [Camponotus floridanus]